MKTRKSEEKRIQKEVRRRREHDRKMLLYQPNLENMNFDERLKLEIAELNRHVDFILAHGYCGLAFVGDEHIAVMFKTSMWELDEDKKIRLKQGGE